MNRWEYLTTKEFSIRHHIAEYFIKDCDMAIDVGSYKKTLNFSGNLYSIDPLKTIDDSFHGTISEWYAINYNNLTNNYGVVCLGLDINGSQKEFEILYELIKKSKVTVIEFAIEYIESINQFKAIQETVSNKKISHKFDVEYPMIKTEGFKPFTKRRLIVLS